MNWTLKRKFHEILRMFFCHVTSVPPLEGFVMNRVLGDYFETLLYKIFVSIDEHTSIAEVRRTIQTNKLLMLSMEPVTKPVFIYLYLVAMY